jgi:hypothetical protein
MSESAQKREAAKRTDTERLDWLIRIIRERNYDLNVSRGGEWFFETDTSNSTYTSARAAIDGEMDYEAREAKRKRPSPQPLPPSPGRRRRP